MGTENKTENMETKIDISLASPEDAEGIQNVFYKTWLATYPNEKIGITQEDVEDKFKNAFSEETLANRRGRLANPPDGEMFFVAKIKNEIVSVCRIQKSPFQNSIRALYVLPEYQGKGIGILLWEEALKHVDLTKDISVRVATYNKTAINFYEKLDFKDTGKRFEDERLRMKSGVVIPEMEMVRKHKGS